MSKNKDFFKKKESKEVIFPEEGDYDPTNFDNDLISCGIIDANSFKSRHEELFRDLIVDSSNENPVAIVAKRLEEAFTPREMAFLLSKDLLQVAYEESVEQLKQK